MGRKIRKSHARETEGKRKREAGKEKSREEEQERRMTSTESITFIP